MWVVFIGVYTASRSFSLSTPVFLSPQKTTFPNSNSILGCTGISNELLWTPGAPCMGKQIISFLHLLRDSEIPVLQIPIPFHHLGPGPRQPQCLREQFANGCRIEKHQLGWLLLQNHHHWRLQSWKNVSAMQVYWSGISCTKFHH